MITPCYLCERPAADHIGRLCNPTRADEYVPLPLSLEWYYQAAADGNGGTFRTVFAALPGEPCDWPLLDLGDDVDDETNLTPVGSGLVASPAAPSVAPWWELALLLVLALLGGGRSTGVRSYTRHGRRVRSYRRRI